MLSRTLQLLTVAICTGLMMTISAMSAQAPPPTETLKQPIDAVIQILRDPAYQAPDQKSAQRTKIWTTIKALFDFDEVSKRTVGAKWATFTDEEKKRFTTVFSEFLGNTYVDKMQGEFHNEKVIFLSEMVKEPLALVRTKLTRETLEIPIDYRMKWANGRWLIYDILVEEGVSLVKNYRVQFQTILQKETPTQLIERLEKKLADQQMPLSKS